MRSPKDGFSKMWIYLPLYIAVVAISVWLLYRYLNPTKVVSKTAFASCFDEGRRYMDGALSLTPAKELEKSLKSFSQSCADAICDEIKDIVKNRSSSEEFYYKAFNGNDCFLSIVDESIKYHNKWVTKLDHLALFYHSGSINLSSSQKNKLDNFLSYYQTKLRNYRLLVIGRASSTGTRTNNLKLSNDRAYKITNHVAVNYPKLEYSLRYFGDAPPKLSARLADQFNIPLRDYKNIRYGSGSDRDYDLRLNQSVLLVIYPKNNDPFELDY